MSNEITRHGTTARWSDVVIYHGIAYFVEVPDRADETAEQQFFQVLAQVEARLRMIGSSKSNLLQVVVYLPIKDDLDSFNRVWESWLPQGTAPSRACVHAELAIENCRIELVITAAVDSNNL